MSTTRVVDIFYIWVLKMSTELSDHAFRVKFHAKSRTAPSRAQTPKGVARDA